MWLLEVTQEGGWDYSFLKYKIFIKSIWEFLIYLKRKKTAVGLQKHHF